MLEDTVVNCPVCDKELHAKVFTSGKKQTYIVNIDCPNCKTSSGKIERKLNSSGRTYIYGRKKLSENGSQRINIHS